MIQNIERLYNIFNFPRAYKKQKEKAREEILQELRALGYEAHVSRDKGLIKTHNNIVTKCDNPKYIISAHYDTVLPFPFTASRFLMKMGTLFQGLLIPQILILIVSLIVAFSIGINFKNSDDVSMIIFAALVLFTTYRLNPYPITPADDNTSGVIAILSIAKRLKDRKDIQYIFFDDEEFGLKGSKAYIEKRQPSKSIRVINIDCVGRGELICVNNYKNQSLEYVEDIISSSEKEIRKIKNSSSDCKSFSKKGYEALTIIRKDKAKPLFKKDGESLEWIHTTDDIFSKIDFKRIDEIITIVCNYIKR